MKYLFVYDEKEIIVGHTDVCFPDRKKIANPPLNMIDRLVQSVAVSRSWNTYKLGGGI